MMTEVTIRQGRESDVEAVWQLVYELAAYERAPEEVITSPEIFRRDGFGKHPLFSILIAERANEVVGTALCYVRYSTWKGPVLFLEDLVVRESERGKGIGDRLFRAVLKQMVDSGYHGMVWQVLDWNEPAIRFYNRYGATMKKGWENMTITADQARAALTA